MIDDARSRRASRGIICPHVDLSLFPSPAQTHRLLSTACKRKAVGEDGIGGDIWALFADVLTPAIHPLLTKMLLAVEVPIVLKGGMLAELWKGKGSRCSIPSYRDIMIQDHPAKLLGACIRPHLRAAVELVSRPTQWGSGLHGGSTETGHLALRAMMDIVRLQRCSGAVIFFDVVSAFATFRRRVVLDCDASDESWLRLLVCLGFTSSEASDIVCSACDKSIWEESGASNHLLSLLSECYQSTWFSTEGIDGVVSFDSGSMAGTSPADLVFTLAMTKILNNLHCELAAKGLIATASCAGSEIAFHRHDMPPESVVKLLDVSFVDDVALPVCSSADAIIDSIRNVSESALVAFARHGLELNFCPGKSECLIHWAGAGATTHRLRHMTHGAPCVPCRWPSGRIYELPISDSYKHLGTRTTFAPTAGAEAVIRSAIIHSEVRALRRRVLSNSAVSTQRRLSLAQAMIFSRGLFQASSWAVVDGAPFRRLHTAVMSVYRCIAGAQWDPDTAHLTDSHVLLSLGAPSAEVLLRRARIMCFIRICSRGSPYLLRLLHAASTARGSWVSSVVKDLEWLAICSPDLNMSASSPFSMWCKLVQADR